MSKHKGAGSAFGVAAGSASRCCYATMKVGGEGTTHFFVCTECGEPCDQATEPQEACGGRCGESDCDLDTYGRPMRAPNAGDVARPDADKHSP